MASGQRCAQHSAGFCWAAFLDFLKYCLKDFVKEFLKDFLKDFLIFQLIFLRIQVTPRIVSVLAYQPNVSTQLQANANVLVFKSTIIHSAASPSTVSDCPHVLIENGLIFPLRGEPVHCARLSACVDRKRFAFSTPRRARPAHFSRASALSRLQSLPAQQRQQAKRARSSQNLKATVSKPTRPVGKL